MKLKKILSIILSLVLLFSITAGIDFSASALSSSGSCGTNVTYTFNESTGELVISGTGAMDDSSIFQYDSRIKTVTINSGVTSIGDYAFYGCTGLTSITIPNSITSIGSWAFQGCTGLTSVTLGNSVTSIGERAFGECTSLKSIVIPDSVTSIDGYAFFYCTGLTSITIPNSITSIGSLAFHGCTGLTSIKVDENNEYYDSRNYCNAIIKTSTNQLIVGCKNTIIPDSVTSIGECAFSGCTGLTSIVIPDSVKSIGALAFSSCTGLTSIVIPNSVTSIGENVFNKCTSLKSIVIPDSVTSIEWYAFEECTSLKSIVIPDSVTSIGYGAFSGCTGLTSILISNSVTSIGERAFYRCKRLTNVYYHGTEEDWNKISISSDNSCLTNANVVYNAHEYVVTDSLEKTCTTDGYIEYTCECGKIYREYLYASHKYELLDSIETTCTDDGLYIYMCSECGDVLTEEPKAFGHDVVIDEAVEVGCLKDGLTRGSHCGRCNEILVKQEVIKALGHSYALTDSKANSCTEDGYKTYTCSRCNDSYTDIIEKTGHTNFLYRTTVTCEKSGFDVYKCSVCSALTSVNADAPGHSYEFIGEENGTLTYKCSTCDSEHTESASDVFNMWSFDMINQAPEPMGTNNSSLLDVINDGIINAKDYAMLLMLAN